MGAGQGALRRVARSRKHMSALLDKECAVVIVPLTFSSARPRRLVACFVRPQFLKPSPAASPIVNRCIECGFCESNCPSRDITLTPRQRISVYREMYRLKQLGPGASEEEKKQLAVSERGGQDYGGGRGARAGIWGCGLFGSNAVLCMVDYGMRFLCLRFLHPVPHTTIHHHLSPPHTAPQAMSSSYAYDGEQTCAADGMCQEKCPVKINTGDLIKVGLRQGAESRRCSVLTVAG